MHLKIVDRKQKAETPKLKQLRPNLSPKIKSLVEDSLFAACFALFFALNLNAAMHEWTQHQEEWVCFLDAASASFCLFSFLCRLWSGLSHLDQ